LVRAKKGAMMPNLARWIKQISGGRREDLGIESFMKADQKVSSKAPCWSTQVPAWAQHSLEDCGFFVAIGSPFLPRFPFGHKDALGALEERPHSLGVEALFAGVGGFGDRNLICVKKLLRSFAGRSAVTNVSPVNDFGHGAPWEKLAGEAALHRVGRLPRGAARKGGEATVSSVVDL
jgi:hypothetical protein